MQSAERPTKRRKLASKSKRKPATARGASGPTFPAQEIHNLLIKGKPTVEVKPEVSLYLSAAQEYLMTEILEKAGNHAIHRRNKVIEVKDIMEAIQADEELNELLGKTVLEAVSHTGK
nr:histone H2A type 1-D-like [Parasteatoda tepidariorum]